DPLIGKAKDFAAAAVLLTAIAAATVGAIVFIPKILNLI
ncbi:MAG: diacylglycerol kinase, partial [Muribaculaceae bacterium]|nr:diacylglycerol kinase [Muribaculaceae bacterium]